MGHEIPAHQKQYDEVKLEMSQQGHWDVHTGEKSLGKHGQNQIF